MEVDDNWSYKTHKATVKSSPPTKGMSGCPSCHPTNSVRAITTHWPRRDGWLSWPCWLT